MPSQNLEYRPVPIDPKTDRPLRILRNLLWICALLPMSLGILDLLLYALADQEWLIYVGLILLPAGALVVFTGLCLLIAWIIRRQAFARRGGTTTNWAFPLGIGTLLLSNFGVALLCMWLGVILIAAPTLSIAIENETGAPLDLCRVKAAWSPETKTALPDKSLTWFRYRLRRVHAINIHLEQAGKSLDLTPAIPPSPGPGQSSPTIHYRIRPGLVALQPNEPSFLRD